MKRFAIVMFTLCGLALQVFAKDEITIDVRASHAVTMNEHTAVGTLFASSSQPEGSSGRQIQSYNLDAIINGEHVVLACKQLSKGFASVSPCVEIPPGKYSGTLNRGKFVVLRFSEPLTHKDKTQNYEVQGSWAEPK